LPRRPTLLDIRKAHARILPHITRTPLYRYLALDELLGGAEVWVKHENHQRLGAFKMRGGINFMGKLSDEEKRTGVVTASTGNHGQSIAFAAGLFGVHAIIIVPEGANPGKVASMRALGADVRFYGRDFDESREEVERLSKEEGFKYIHSAEEPALIEGVGTYGLEIMDDLPGVDVIIVPVGAGSGACGTAIAAKSIKPEVKVIGVQAAAAPAAYESWRTGEMATLQMGTVAEGLATRVGFSFTIDILRDLLDDFVLVSDEDLKRAVVLALEHTHNLAEHAGAAALAAGINMKDRLAGKTVVLVQSGGNLSLDHLREALGASL
jgi:threonine dehydratase